MFKKLIVPQPFVVPSAQNTELRMMGENVCAVHRLLSDLD